jgi:hypothetical protein
VTTINNTVTKSVTLGSSGYTSPLSITSTGQLNFSSDGSNTTLTGPTGTISTAIYPGITAGAGNYSSVLLITNTGAITSSGGAGGSNSHGALGYEAIPTNGGTGGLALSAGSGASITNQGAITGGAGGGGGSDFNNQYNSPVTGAAGGAGAAGASLSGAMITNAGNIAGGTGGAGGNGAYDNSNNYQTASGGGAGGAGGDGLDLSAGSGANQGVITGGQGGTGGTGGFFIKRFGGGYGYYGGGNGGGGGNGLALSGGANFTNTGTLAGGAGGAGGFNGARTTGQHGRAGGGVSGAGAYVIGGTLVNAGTISGSNAVVLGANAGTLVVESGAVFNGKILANSAVADVLEFAGSSASEFSGIGTSTEGFTQISFAPGAAWTIEGNTSGLASGQSITGFAAGDKIILDNVAAASETLNAGKLTLGGAVLALGASSDNFVVVDNGTNSTLAVAPASISLAAGSTYILSGHAAGLTASSITGFATGDTIELEGFAATSETYVSGVGLVLSNGTSFDTLAVNSFSGFFAERTDGTNTTIFARAPVSIISTHIGSSGVPSYVTLANGIYASALTLTATGVVGYGSNLYAPMSYRGFLPGKIDIYAASGLGGVSLTNLGVIDEADTGVELLSPGYVKNSNLISTNHNGIVLKAGGTIVNSGIIKAFGYFGIKLQAGGTVINSGYISGGDGGIYSGQGLTLIEAPGAAFGNGGRHSVEVKQGYYGTLDLTGGKASQDISNFAGISNINFAHNAAWDIAIQPTNNYFDGVTITGFTSTDTLDLKFFVENSYNFDNGVLTVVNANGQGYQFKLPGPFTNGDFTFTGDGDYGTDITTDVQCFAAGTRILTPDGEVAVEELAVGDTVITVREGGALTRRIVWTGCQRINLARQPEPALLRPVRITAGALGDGVPERDLRLSPHHAIYLDGLLFEAICLVNGTTIFQEQGNGCVSYHHIELEEHDIVLAEGAACESYLDTGSRHLFGMELFPDYRAPEDATFCVPLIREGEALDAVRRAIHLRTESFYRAA